jgi:hypothetical protein
MADGTVDMRAYSLVVLWAEQMAAMLDEYLAAVMAGLMVVRLAGSRASYSAAMKDLQRAAVMAHYLAAKTEDHSVGKPADQMVYNWDGQLVAQRAGW